MSARLTGTPSDGGRSYETKGPLRAETRIRVDMTTSPDSGQQELDQHKKDSGDDLLYILYSGSEDAKRSNRSEHEVSQH